MATREDSLAVVQRLSAATNVHDLDGIVACFAADYHNETPAHPDRSFDGADQVRRNWAQILAGVPDIHAEIVAHTTDGNTVWSEWEHRGTRPDGSPHVMRGVIVFEVLDGQIARARFYLEPLEHHTGDVDSAVARQVAGPVSS